MSESHDITVTVNGEVVRRTIEDRMLLSDFLRQCLRLTGTHVGCEQGVCGACTVLINGVSARSCLMLAVQTDGTDVVTVEGLDVFDEVSSLLEAFRNHHALQCGFCTPGFLTTCVDILHTRALHSEEEVRDALSGNLCRCTGYEHIIAAVLDVIGSSEALP